MSDEPQEHQLIQKTAHAAGELMDATLHDLPFPLAVPAVMIEGLAAGPVLINAFAADEVNDQIVQPLRHLVGGDSGEASAPNIDLPTEEEPVDVHTHQATQEDAPPLATEEYRRPPAAGRRPPAATLAAVDHVV